MRTQAIGFVIAALTATMASGQPSAPQSTVVHLANGETAENLQLIAITIRVVGGIQQVSVDTAKAAVAVDGTADQVAFAQWLVDELHNPAGGPPPANSAAHGYVMPGSSDDVVRVLYVSHSATMQNLQEIGTIVRLLSDVPRLVFYDPQRALAARGTAAQISAAEWLVKALDQLTNAQTSASAEPHEYRTPGTSDVLRVFHLTHSGTPQTLQEISVLIRTIADIRRVIAYTAQPALAARGTDAQIALAEWLVNEMDRPANAQTSASPAPHEYRMPGTSDDVVRVFYVTHSETPQDLQKVAGAVRSATNTRRVLTNSAQKAVLLRGTADQIATAERVINEAR